MLRDTAYKFFNFVRVTALMLLVLITSTTALLVGLLLSTVFITVALLSGTFRRKATNVDNGQSDVIDLNKSEYSSVAN